MSDPNPPAVHAVALVADLLFAARVRGTAREAGATVVLVRSAAELPDQVRSLRPDLAIVDLDARSGDPAGAIARLKADPATAATRVVAFGSHVDTAAIAAARQAGADRVLARSAFVRELPSLLRPGQP